VARSSSISLRPFLVSTWRKVQPLQASEPCADLVVVEARGEMMTKTGVRYDNEYSLVYPTGARKIVDTPSIAIRRCASRCLARFRKIGRKWRLERRRN
jgi:hypothetical protein